MAHGDDFNLRPVIISCDGHRVGVSCGLMGPDRNRPESKSLIPQGLTMLIRLTLFALFASLCCANAFAEHHFVCKTSKYTAIIDRLPAGDYRYRVWNKPKSMSQASDLVVLGGVGTVEGTGPCRHRLWMFNNGDVEYIVSTLGCTESIPPEGTIGEISVFVGGEYKKSWWCAD